MNLQDAQTRRAHESGQVFTFDQLRPIAQQMSADLAKPPGSVTLLYSGSSGVTVTDPFTGDAVAVANCDIDGEVLRLADGMQVQAEINQGSRTVLEYLLSPVQKAAQEAAGER